MSQPVARPAEQGGWVTLFDGKDTSKLRGYRMDSFPADRWVIDGNALKTVPGSAIDLITRDKYTNFVLEVEWKVTPAGNSGIIYNVAETEGAAWSTGPEMQILDDDRHPDGKNPKTTAGSLYALIAPAAEKRLKPVGEFNQAKLVIHRGQVEHWLNGVKLLQYQWRSPEVRALIQQSKFKEMPLFMSQDGGHIAFQHHGEEAWFRNIRIKRLD